MSSELSPSSLAPGLLLGAGVELGENVELGANVVIHAGTVVGDGCAIDDGALIGRHPRLGPVSTASREAPPPAVLESGAAVLAGAIVYAGVRLGPGAIVGDQAQVRERTTIGEQSMVGRGSAVDNDVRIGAAVKIQTNAYVTAGTIIEDHVFIGPGVTTTNDDSMQRHPRQAEIRGPILRRACRIGAGSVLRPRVEIGEEAFVAAGAVVIGDVAPRLVVAGVPATELRRVGDEDLLERWR